MINLVSRRRWPLGRGRRGALTLVPLALVALLVWAQSQSAWGDGRLAGAENLSQAISRIESQTAVERGLQPKRAVVVTILPSDQFTARLLRDFDRDTSAHDIAIADRVYVLLGLLDPKADLRAIFRRAFGSSVVGFYDPRTKRLYVRATGRSLSAYEQVVLSHEYTHALQDQYFDLRRLQGDSAARAVTHNSDRDSAIQAVVEGDATLEMLLYARDYLNSGDRAAFLKGESGAAPAGVPAYITDALQFPYAQGLEFTTAIYRQGGVKALNDLFKRPPQGTDQILHPQLYQAGGGGALMPGVTALAPLTLPAGWSLEDSDVVGEFQIRDFLAQSLPADAASSAAQGWRGDRYALYIKGKHSVMVWRSVWADQAQAAAFRAAFARYIAGRLSPALVARLIQVGPTVSITLTSDAVAAQAYRASGGLDH